MWVWWEIEVGHIDCSGLWLLEAGRSLIVKPGQEYREHSVVRQFNQLRFDLTIKALEHLQGLILISHYSEE